MNFKILELFIELLIELLIAIRTVQFKHLKFYISNSSIKNQLKILKFNFYIFKISLIFFNF